VSRGRKIIAPAPRAASAGMVAAAVPGVSLGPATGSGRLRNHRRAAAEAKG